MDKAKKGNKKDSKASAWQPQELPYLPNQLPDYNPQIGSEREKDPQRGAWGPAQEPSYDPQTGTWGPKEPSYDPQRGTWGPAQEPSYEPQKGNPQSGQNDLQNFVWDPQTKTYNPQMGTPMYEHRKPHRESDVHTVESERTDNRSIVGTAVDEAETLEITSKYMNQRHQQEIMNEAQEWQLTTLLWCAHIIIFPLLFLGLAFDILMEYERLVILRLGRVLRSPKGPGLVVYFNLTDEVFRIDLRLVTKKLPLQQILTVDSVTVDVDAVLNYKIIDPMASVVMVTNVHKATIQVAMAILRNNVARYSLSELLKKREKVSMDIMNEVQSVTRVWGVNVELLQIQDIELPDLMKSQMAVEAQTKLAAEAQVIRADGESRAAEKLKEAGKNLNAPTSLHLKSLQTLIQIALNRRSKMIFPIPFEGLIDSFPCSGECDFQLPNMWEAKGQIGSQDTWIKPFNTKDIGSNF